MITTVKPKLTFEEFLELSPNCSHYELVDGELVERSITRNHIDIADFLDRCFYDEVKRSDLSYVIKQSVLLRTLSQDGTEQGRMPDVSVIDRDDWRANRSDYAALRSPIQLAVEVVSTNWDDDYIDKLDEYQRMGIHEYWIVDYLALGGREYLGKPKLPTIFVYVLDDKGEYQRSMFRGNDAIASSTFPELQLTAEQILKA
ncbi:Uma2 family endonuclease [Tumidithrix elongata RA019]|uniref:Uma2 family endonuclease n=1 Tax=Tumidithrix elongata BACA0141 TaxID=2716417 RepID=A0AAW9PV41_9CYAN|nr:Uma2 family endonuclease [Tumidithrix elongata RA019]